MAEHPDMLRAAEAAIVSGLAIKQVDRAVEDRVLPDGFVVVAGGRRFTLGACVMMAFYHDTAKDLTPELRRHVIGRFEGRLRNVGLQNCLDLTRENWSLNERYLRVDLAPFIERAGCGYERFRAAKAAVSTSSDVMGGMEVLRGTRVPVRDVAASVAAGYPRERIKAAYPSLSDEQIDLSVVYAASNPVRGRPRAPLALPASMKVVEGRIARRKKAG